MKTYRFRAALLAASILTVSGPASIVLAPPASAAWIVYDPTNYSQNLLSAARALEQINNQITSLQNEAQMLINQARNLASLPYSSLQQIQQSVSRTQQLLSQAQNIAFDVGQIDQAFQSKYANVSLSATDAQLVADAKERWKNSVGGLQDAMRVQATVVGNIDTNRTEMSQLVGQSQSATGALQAAQAGNQLLALQSQQLSDLTALLAANGRSTALTEAERAAAAEQGRVQRQRFLTPGSDYQAGRGKMFSCGRGPWPAGCWPVWAPSSLARARSPRRRPR
ncbi:P-type conjugative transfer protein TrbJ [Agrobacterium vitis]|uniref:P-type conjugative transfer protein TrbJ n=1 Tax=Agrobacterium vitis TaxID=373 RepID=UPI002033AEC0|nr:P-type conjugative transfer protein TrbJ [Agrobacterium vitis]MCM2449040.1 P-type conjugative transfer protein TrbJ [Agrobacterium vitis]